MDTTQQAENPASTPVVDTAAPSQPTPSQVKSSAWIWVTLGGLIVIALIGAFFWLGRSAQMKDDANSPSPLAQGTNDNNNSRLYHYVNKANGFSVDVPQSWKVDQSGQYGSLVSFINKDTSGQGEQKFFINIGVGTEDLPPGTTADEYIVQAKTALSKYLTKYSLVNSTPFDVGSYKGFIIEGKFEQGEITVHNAQLITVKGDVAYIVTGTTLDEFWSKDKDTLLTIMKTFRFNE